MEASQLVSLLVETELEKDLNNVMTGQLRQETGAPRLVKLRLDGIVIQLLFQTLVLLFVETE